MPKNFRVTAVINNQFTDSPNTTQIASGAGKSSAAGNNAALNSSNTEQQQSVGAQGLKRKNRKKQNEIVIAINNQKNRTKGTQSAATQVGKRLQGSIRS
ncbi:hypothetical protein [Alteribacillus bidgolensis]|uniref:Uncharacterized protein n=1 Tax=Alteribacillus bidgolensis TaxID=930129 RepID=A0A1G8HAA9_9BACI|nr:hypothetical protein [Alteribacillus bidgolensis]SDI03576.1 hypothetical protein SAMN05216352_104176 [Alteribacillus bidgolensis]